MVMSLANLRKIFLILVVAVGSATFQNAFRSLSSTTTDKLLFHGVNEILYNGANHVSSEFAREHLVRELETFSHRYYIYSDRRISQDMPSTIVKEYHRRYSHEEEYERIIQDALRNHSLRTDNPDEATLFIVPTPVAKILITKGLSYDDAFSALTSHPIFKQYQGKKHIILSIAHVTYSYENKHYVKPLSKWLPKLANVTVVMGHDPVATEAAYLRGDLLGDDYEAPFSKVKPMAHHSFSLGLGGASDDFPITPASLNKFNNATYHIFYRTRKTQFLNNATTIRRIPVHNVSKSALPTSSIGFDTTKQEWLDHFKDSKFCLCLRGDSPHSHSLLRSVRAGCIPVVISDLWWFYAPVLKSSMQIEDYAIIIKEEDFIRNPEAELLKLNSISMSVIAEKIANLTLAQRVLLPDHPESLFVPAFLKEALKAMEHTAKTHF